MIALNFHDLHFIVATSLLFRMHTADMTQTTWGLVKAKGSIAIHAEMIIHHHSARKSEINNNCETSYNSLHHNKDNKPLLNPICNFVKKEMIFVSRETVLVLFNGLIVKWLFLQAFRWQLNNKTI